MSKLGRSVLAFGLVGGTATAVHAIVGLSLVSLGLLAPFSANIVAFLLAFLVSYFGHRHFTFQSSTAHRKAAPKFLATAVLGLVLNQVIVYVVVNLLALPYALALAIVVSVVPVMTFLLGKFWAFSPEPETARAMK